MTSDQDKLPLHDEAKARDEWRGGETLVPADAGDTSLPASEADEFAPGGDEGDGRPGRGRPGDFPPPD